MKENQDNVKSDGIFIPSWWISRKFANVSSPDSCLAKVTQSDTKHARITLSASSLWLMSFTWASLEERSSMTDGHGIKDCALYYPRPPEWEATLSVGVVGLGPTSGISVN